MKSFQIAFWIAVLAGWMFVYQVYTIHGQDREAAVLVSALRNNQNPGAGTYIRAFFDGFTLGAFAEEGIFTESKQGAREAKQIQAQCADLLTRHYNSVWYRNCGLVVGTIALVVGFRLKKQTIA